MSNYHPKLEISFEDLQMISTESSLISPAQVEVSIENQEDAEITHVMSRTQIKNLLDESPKTQLSPIFNPNNEEFIVVKKDLLDQLRNLFLQI